MTANLDDDLRTAFDELAATTSISPDPRFGEIAPAPAETSRRPWLALVAAAATVVLVAGLAVGTRDRTNDTVPLDTPPTPTADPAVPGLHLFPDATSMERYLDPVDAVDAYLSDRVTTAPVGQTVTYTMNSNGSPFDGTEDRVLIGFSLTVTPNDAALCCDSGDGVAYVERVDGAWFVTSAEISAMRVHTLGYSDEGIVSGAFSPTIGGTYTITVDSYGSAGPEEDGAVVEHEPDPADLTNGPTFQLPGFTAPAVAVRIWHSPSQETPYPAAMFAEFIVTKGADNVSNIPIEPEHENGDDVPLPADRETLESYRELLELSSSDIELPDGYDLRLDLLEPASDTLDDVNFMLRFRAACTWAHWAISSHDDPDASTAAATTRQLAEHPSVREQHPTAADLLGDLANDIENADNQSVTLFLDANCQGQGLPE